MPALRDALGKTGREVKGKIIKAKHESLSTKELDEHLFLICNILGLTYTLTIIEADGA